MPIANIPAPVTPELSYRRHGRGRADPVKKQRDNTSEAKAGKAEGVFGKRIRPLKNTCEMNEIRTEYVTPDRITRLEPDEIFVFGSNLAGHHGGGAARQAMEWGARWGQGSGLQGQTYAIPTMFEEADEIRPYVDEFIRFAREHPEKHFLVTEIGCGIAGFSPEEIAPLFPEAAEMENVRLPRRLRQVLARSQEAKPS